MFRLYSDHRQGQNYLLIKRCCYLTGDSSIAASHNGFGSYKRSLHIFFRTGQKVLPFYITFIFYHKAVVKPYHWTYIFLALCLHCSVMQPLQNPPLYSSTDWKPEQSYDFWIFTKLDNKTEINLTWILAEILTVKSVDCGPFRLAHGAPFGSIQLFQNVSIAGNFSAFSFFLFQLSVGFVMVFQVIF